MTLAPPPSFAPPGWLVNAHLQSIVPSLRLRRPLVARRARQMLACAQTQIVECGAGVRLLGHYSSQVAAGRPPARDLAEAGLSESIPRSNAHRLLEETLRFVQRSRLDEHRG